MVKRACDRLWEIDPLREGRLSPRDAAAFERHRTVCAECTKRLAEDERLRELARQLPSSDPGPLHVRRVRAQILRRAAAAPAARRPRRLLLAAVALLAVATTTSLWLTRHVPPLRSQNLVESAAASFGAAIDASAGARYVTSREGNAELVILDEGTITLTVRRRVPGERFLVRVPDGELEVRGTRFQVVVASGALSSVQVFEGQVALRRPGAAEEMLVAGRTWAPAHPAEAPPRSLDRAVSVATAPQRSFLPTASRAARRPMVGPNAEASSAVQAQEEYAAAVRMFEQARFEECARALHTFLLAHPLRAEAEDAAFLEATALARAGREDGAALVAERFLESYPASIHVEDVATLATRAARDRADCKTACDLAERWIRPSLRAATLGRCAPRRAE